MRASIINHNHNNIKIDNTIFIKELNQKGLETINSLSKIWLEAGYSDIECKSLLFTLLTKLKDICDNEIKEETNILQHVKNEVIIKYEQYQSYSKQLGRDVVDEQTLLKGILYTILNTYLLYTYTNLITYICVYIQVVIIIQINLLNSIALSRQSQLKSQQDNNY